MGPIKTPENLQVNALILAQNLQIWVGVMTIKALLILAYRIIQGRLFTSRKYTALVSSYGLQQEFITPHCPQQNGMVERLIRTIKEQCVHRYRFESLQHANRVLSDWIQFYNERRPHQALGMKTPTEVYRLSL